jgi:tetratricopeptide (TPR) repeat protein
MMMRKLAILGIFMMAASALAKEAPNADLEKARAHFKSAEGLFRSGAYDRAIDEYQAAHALAPRPGLLYNIGAAYRKKAETTGSIDDKKQAVEYYRKYLEADPGGKATADANGYIVALTEEIAAASPAAPAEPEPVSPRVEPRPVTPPPPPPLTAPPPPPPEPAAPPAESRTSALRIAGIATAGVGVALVATGVYFGLKSKSISDEIDGLHDHWDQGLYDSGQSAQRNAYIFVGVGAAALAGGAVMYFLGHRDDSPAVSVRPSVTPLGGAVVLSGRF